VGPIFFLVAFCVPVLVARLSLQRYDLSLRALFYGVGQEIGWLMILIGSLQESSPQMVRYMAVLLCAFFQLDTLVDAFLYRSTGMRLELSFCVFVKDIGCFWDSAKAKKMAWLYPLGGFFFVAALFIFYKFPLRLSHPFYCLGGGVGILLASRWSKNSKKTSYHLDPIVTLQIVGSLEKWSGAFIKRAPLERLSCPSFYPQREYYSPVSTKYPLLKYTHGFLGDKQLDIEIKPQERPHIIFLFMESFRAKDVGVLGGRFGVTPYFDKLSQEGVLFSRFYANSVKTSRVVTSSLFGIPSDVSASERSLRHDRPLVSLADVLGKEGYHSAYLHNGDLRFENHGRFFSCYGYRTVIGQEKLLKKYPEAEKTSWGVHDEYLMRYSADWLEEKDALGAPLFLTLFTISNHHPWVSPKDYGYGVQEKGLSPLYMRFLKTMQYSDRQLGLLVELLKEKKLLDKTILFIMGDHGHPMGEHEGNFCEQRFLYEENLHVPLLLLADKRLKKPCRIEDPAGQLDLIPTVMDILHMQGLNLARGTSLLRQAERAVFFHNPYGYQFYGMRRGPYKLIYTRASEESQLYHLLQDPEERHNLAALHPDIAVQYANEVKSYYRDYATLYAGKGFSPGVATRN